MTWSESEIEGSDWFQIKANICAQFLSEQNFEIPFYSFFISVLADMMLKR